MMEYLLNDIPAGLWRKVREKAKRDGVSIGPLILALLTDWADGTLYIGPPVSQRRALLSGMILATPKGRKRKSATIR